MIYASRLARLPVRAPDGGSVGIVADLVIGPPAADGPPPVYGLVVTVPGRQIFLGAGRIADIDAEGVRLRSGALNLRRFAKRAAETLVLGDLLDHPIRDGARINDVGIAKARNRPSSWEVAAVDVVSGARLARRGKHHTEPPAALRPLLAERDGHHHLRELHPADAAEQFAGLSRSQQHEAAHALDDEQLADLLEELPHDTRSRLLADLGLERGTDVLEAMQPDDAADVLAEIAPDGRAQLLDAMEPDDASVLRRLLHYGSDTAGGLMHPEPITAAPDATVAETLARLRDPDVSPTIASQAFVVEPPAQTPTGTYLGVCGIQRLLREPPSRRLRSCIDPAPDPLTADEPVGAVAHHLATYNLVAAPTIDERGRLVGVVTVDDVLDHLLPTDWRHQ